MASRRNSDWTAGDMRRYDQENTARTSASGSGVANASNSCAVSASSVASAASGKRRFLLSQRVRRHVRQWHAAPQRERRGQQRSLGGLVRHAGRLVQQGHETQRVHIGRQRVAAVGRNDRVAAQKVRSRVT